MSLSHHPDMFGKLWPCIVVLKSSQD
jgi:hypothetical protein